jgi:Spy/CpxP family protein refolding chaperone
MHPGFINWWKQRHGDDWLARASARFDHGCGAHAGAEAGPWAQHGCGRGGWHASGFDPGDAGGFGVRRPLRFLAHKLELDERQMAVFAAALDELKTERAQAAVDQRRRVSTLAEALEKAEFDEQKLREAGEQQERSASQVRVAVERALRKIHAVLDDEQRTRLAYLLRTGVLSI